MHQSQSHDEFLGFYVLNLKTKEYQSCYTASKPQTSILKSQTSILLHFLKNQKIIHIIRYITKDLLTFAAQITQHSEKRTIEGKR